MVRFFKRNFFLIPAFIVAAACYGSRFSFQNCKSKGLFNPAEVTYISGQVFSTPVKTGGKNKYYKVVLKSEICRTENGAVSTFLGNTNILIPENQFESSFPGKLQTDSRKKEKNPPIEKGIQAAFHVKHRGDGMYIAESIEKTYWNDSFLCNVMKMRAETRMTFRRLMYAWGKAGGFFLALLSGSRDYLEDSISEAFRNAGLSHILALSGMHLALFSNLAGFTGKKLFGKKYDFLIKLPAVFIFVWFAGLSPSLLRALLCTIISFFLTAVKVKEKNMLNILALSFLIHVSILPSDLRELSFIFSYSALAGILIFSEAVNELTAKFIPYTLGNSIAQSSAAQIFTAPVSLKFFGLLTPAGIVASAIISPLVTVFVYSGLFLSILSLLFPAASVFSSFLLNLLYGIIATCAGFFSAWPAIHI